MKKFNRVVLIICLLLFLFGLVGCGVGAAMGVSYGDIGLMIENGSFSIGGEKNDVKTYAKKEVSEMKSIDIDVDYGEVHIYKTKDTEIKVNAEGVSDNYYCELDEKELEVKDKRTGGFFAKFKNIGGVIKIYLPETMEFNGVSIRQGAGMTTVEAIKCEEMDIKVGAGSFQADTLNVAKKVKMNVGAGQLKAEKCELGDVSLNCGVGSIRIDGTITGDTDAECGLGEISMNLTGKESDHNYKIKALGDIKLNDKSFSGISEKQTINNGATSNFTLKCGVGSIRITTPQ